ncbi:MAG: cobalamin-dependent protein [Elusimicrobia bacterium]|nr:cobalamin-dependent protein [Elusimicrobiota bacterium]
MKELDCLFVYPGAPAGKKNLLPIMPAGLLAMAAYLERNSVSAAIISLPSALDGEFDLPGIIRERRVKLVCIPAHWHRQAGGALRLAEQLKRAVPGVRIALGGYTASRFAAEILKEHPAVDFVVRGDGELPLLKLLGSLGTGGRSLGRVPNLAWRGKEGVTLNRTSYAAGSATLTGLGLAGLRFVLNRRLTPRRGICFEDGMFTYVQARGCADNCSACGGGRDAQRRMCGRRGVALKSPASVVRDFAELAAMGIKEIQLPLNPLPSDAYYIALLKLLMKKKLRPVLKIELCGLPSGKLLKWLGRALGPESKITIFAGSGSEKIRRLNRGRFYTNAGLMAALRLASRLGVKAWTAFTTGLPFETRRDFLATAALVRRMRREFKIGRSGVYVFSLEPGSPLFEDPEKYGVTLRRRTLKDFLAQRGKYDMGYSTACFTEREIVRNLKFLEKTAR